MNLLQILKYLGIFQSQVHKKFFEAPLNAAQISGRNQGRPNNLIGTGSCPGMTATSVARHLFGLFGFVDRRGEGRIFY